MKTKFFKIFNFGLDLTKTQTAKDSLISLVGSGASGLLGLVFTAIIARILSPEKFGKFSTLVNYILLIAALNDLGINQGLISFIGKTKGVQQKKWVKLSLKLILKFSLIFACLATLAFWFLLSNLWQIDKNFSLLIFISIIINSLYLFFAYLFQAFKSFFKKALFENIFSTFRMIFLGFALIFAKLNIFLSILLTTMGALSSVIFGWFSSSVNLSNLHSIKLDIKKIRKLLRFSKWLGLNNVLIQVYGRIDILMLAWLANSFTTGTYSSASRLMLVFPVIISSFSSVVAPRFASFSDFSATFSYFKKTLFASLGIAISMGILMIIIAHLLISIIYGKAYLTSVPVFQVLTLAFLPLVLSIPTTNSLIYFFKKPFVISFISGVQLTVVIILNLIFIPKFSGLGPALSFLISNVFGLVLGYLFFFKEVRVRKGSILHMQD